MNPRTLSFSLLPWLLISVAVAQARRPLPDLDEATRIFAAAADRPLAWPEFLDRVSRLDAVFLGETHIDDTTHRVELAVLEGLLERREGKVVLSLEMFERDAQPVLDAYLAGEIEEAEFLAKSGAWGNYQTAYRPLIETAKAAGIPVVAANFPRSLRRPLAMGGKRAIEALSPAQRALMPDEIYPASEEYWQRVGRAVRGHMGGGGAGTPEERLYDTQNLWDNSMGDSVARALADHPGAVVLHVAGGFHTAYRDGTVAQFARRSAGSRFAVAQIVPVGALPLARPDRDREQADYRIFAQAVARDFNEGTYAVSVAAELRYRLDVPKGRGGLPLLVWLPDRATRPEDAFAYWREALGDEAAVAVVEPPFPEVQDDLALGGRYVFGDGFRADYGRMQDGLVRLVDYVSRRFPIDPSRIVVAGAGDGGAVVLWTALYGEWLEHDHVAIDPTDLTRLSMEALPDIKPAARALQLVARNVPKARLEQVAADYVKVGTDASVVELGKDRTALVDLLRTRLTLPGRASDANAAPVFLVLESDLPRAREWAELYAERLLSAGNRARVVPLAGVESVANPGSVRRLAVGGTGYWQLDHFVRGEGLPLAGGPFGGTTVVVLPKGVSAEDREAWLEHEQNKVIKRRSMFANIAIAELDGERSLPAVVARLRQMGRSRVLFVPAVFCADAATMRTLRETLGDAADGMDAAWLPGLGAELALGGR